MPEKKIKVSIGLPVYNGENFIVDAIESILNQTFRDFELIISDNASTDATEAICRNYCSQDNRVKYYRNSENLGASANYIRVFNLAKGRYFKWAAHDDVCRPEFLTRCVEVLDSDPSVVLCYAKTITIDADGQPRKEWDARPAFSSTIPVNRYREVFEPLETFPIWGLIRSEILRKTPLLGNYTGHDLPLLGELSLYGKFHEIPEFLFLSREHPQRSVRAYDFNNPYKAIAWYDPDRANKLIFPTWRLLTEQLAAVKRPPLKIGERLPCYQQIARWTVQNREDLWRDVAVALQHLPIVGGNLKKWREKRLEISWNKEIDQVLDCISSKIPSGENFILIDENSLDAAIFPQWKVVPFLEKDGAYYGLPPDDHIAIQEVERLKELGASFVVLIWSSFWWLDHYTEFFEYLNRNFHRTVSTNKVIVYDLH